MNKEKIMQFAEDANLVEMSAEGLGGCSHILNEKAIMAFAILIINEKDWEFEEYLKDMEGTNHG